MSDDEEIPQEYQATPTKPASTQADFGGQTPRTPQDEIDSLVDVGSDITDQQAQVVHDWLDTHASRCFAVCEGGAAAGKLHVQAVATIFTSGSLPVAKSLKEALRWIPHVPPGSKVMVSELAEKDMHTYLGMLGYCNKDAHKPAADFRVIIDVGNTPAMMEDGRIIFMKYHATSKGKVALSPSNILQKMVAYMNANRMRVAYVDDYAKVSGRFVRVFVAIPEHAQRLLEGFALERRLEALEVERRQQESGRVQGTGFACFLQGFCSCAAESCVF
eukprot:jgi/Mesvir1/13091/Mv06073-RA.1